MSVINLKEAASPNVGRASSTAGLEVPPYAGILNRKLVIPGAAGAPVGVDEHFLFELMLPMLNRIRVDEAWYLSHYPDVSLAVRSAAVAGAKAHYSRFGYYEHRMPYKIVVKESWYVGEYPDLKGAVAAGLFASGQEHFELVGYKEGRFPYPDFRLDTV